MNEPIIRHDFIFNPEDNGGEEVSLSTEFFSNGEEIFTTHQFILNSYGNSAILHLGIQITPTRLRLLADQLEKFMLIVRKNT